MYAITFLNAVDLRTISFCLCPETGYKPQVEVSFVTGALGFDGEDTCMEFLKKAGCVVTGDSKEYQLNTKDSVIDSSAIITKEKLLL